MTGADSAGGDAGQGGYSADMVDGSVLRAAAVPWLPVVISASFGCTPAPPVQAPWNPSQQEAPASNGADASPDEPTSKSESAQLMHGWFVQLASVHDAVVAGDGVVRVSKADALGRGIDAIEAVPESWQHHSTELRSRVGGLTDAATPPGEAAAALADATSTCGDCHVATGVVEAVEAALPDDGAPPEGDRMQQHAWAAQRMWEGIVTPSERRWIRGTAAFALLPTCPDEASESDADTGAAAPAPEGTDPATLEACTRAHRLARRGHNVDAWPARTALYGELLATCASCHARTKLGPPADAGPG